MAVVNIKEIQVEPPVLEAVQVSMSNIQEVATWLGGYQADVHMKFNGGKNEISFFSADQTIKAAEGCWIIKDSRQTPNHYVLTDEVFNQKFQILLGSGENPSSQD